MANLAEFVATEEQDKFRSDKVPAGLRLLLAHVIQADEIDNWMQDQTVFSEHAPDPVFQDRSPYEVLQLAASFPTLKRRDLVALVVHEIYTLVAFASTPDLPPEEDLVDQIVEELAAMAS